MPASGRRPLLRNRWLNDEPIVKLKKPNDDVIMLRKVIEGMIETATKEWGVDVKRKYKRNVVREENDVKPQGQPFRGRRPGSHNKPKKPKASG